MKDRARFKQTLEFWNVIMCSLCTVWSNLLWIFSLLHIHIIQWLCKANSVQEACIKCLAVHILKFEILQTNKKMKQKCSVFTIQLDMLERLKNEAYKSLCFVFHAGFKISNFSVWTAKHLIQASWTELASFNILTTELCKLDQSLIFPKATRSRLVLHF